MRLCVVAPSQGYLELAGVRIRYNRLIERLGERGVEVRIRVIDDLRRSSFDEHDHFLISKGYDGRSLLLARMLAASGRAVGVDLFDDYFSQAGDSRFIHLRSWMREIAPHLMFALCSTARMAAVAEQFMPQTPRHVLNDPFATFDVARIASLVEANLAEASATRRLRIGWFGTGDNKYFPVGLEDVHAFREALAPWSAHGYTAELSILTNLRALTPYRLELLRALPIPVRIEEWSEEREAAQVASSLFCFLPTNAQNFSAAKSMNRAVTALTGGAQVLSVGYPLYAPLERFIYRCPLGLLRDLEAGKPLVRRESLPELGLLLRDYADPDREAEAFADFLRKLSGEGKPRVSPRAGSDVVLHGLQSSSDVHKLTQRLAQYSAGAPFSNEKLNYDLRFVLDAPREALNLEVSEGVLSALTPRLQEFAVALPKPQGKRTHKLLAVTREARLMAQLRHISDPAVPGGLIAFYPAIMQMLQAELARLLPGIRCVISEREPLLWAGACMNSADATELAHAV